MTVACHGDGTTWGIFCHKDGATWLPVMGLPDVSCRWSWSLSCSDAAKSSDLEAGADGVREVSVIEIREVLWGEYRAHVCVTVPGLLRGARKARGTARRSPGRPRFAWGSCAVCGAAGTRTRRPRASSARPRPGRQFRQQGGWPQSTPLPRCGRV